MMEGGPENKGARETFWVNKNVLLQLFSDSIRILFLHVILFCISQCSNP